MTEYLLLPDLGWREVVQVPLNEQQIQLLFSRSPETRQGIQAMLNSVEAQRKLPVLASKEEELDSFHESIKPPLQENDTYEIIYLSIFQKPTGGFIGVLKYSLNGITKLKRI